MVTQTQLTSGSGTSASSFTTASIAPSTAQLIVISIISKISSTNPSEAAANGLGLSWNLAGSVLQTGSQHVRLNMYYALSLTPITPGTMTVTFASQVQDDFVWNVTQLGNVFADSSDGVNSIIQIQTSNTGGVNPSVNYNTFAKPTNAAFGVVGSLNLGTSYTPGGSFSQIFSNTSSQEIIEGAFLGQSATSVGWTQGGGQNYPTAVIALEINFLPSGALLMLF